MEILWLAHEGVKGQRWGLRRYQNEDGSLTSLGRVHYGVGPARVSARRGGSSSNSSEKSDDVKLPAIRSKGELDSGGDQLPVVRQQLPAVQAQGAISSGQKYVDDIGDEPYVEVIGDGFSKYRNVDAVNDFIEDAEFRDVTKEAIKKAIKDDVLDADYRELSNKSNNEGNKEPSKTADSASEPKKNVDFSSYFKTVSDSTSKAAGASSGIDEINKTRKGIRQERKYQRQARKLTDSELQDYTDRMILEKKYVDAKENTHTLKTGKSFTTKFITGAAGAASAAVSVATLVKMFKEIKGN